MRESEVMGNYHASFGERDGETRPMRVGKVRAVPTLLSPVSSHRVLDGLEAVVHGSRWHRRTHTINYGRWADDFMVTANARQV